jgi:serine/threonine protein kinase/tetratricopeptide (TPR) repeat protein
MINRRYTLLRLLGRGGSGEVYLAEDSLSGHRRIALKAFHSAELGGLVDRTQFFAEVSLVLGLSHPNIIEMYDAGRVHRANDPLLVGRDFFTMELVEGTDALTWVTSLGTNKDRPRAIASLLSQSLNALQYLHGEGVIHYDIKPHNLMISGIETDPATPFLKLTDFGFSHRREGVSAQERRGTLHYMAPELLRGDTGDQRIDLYSLGATFFHLIEGHPPSDAPTATDLVKMILQQEPVLSPTDDPLLAGVQGILQRLLCSDPAERFSSAGEAARACAHLMKEVLDEQALVTLRPSFVGRHSELATLQTAIHEVAESDSPSEGTSFCVTGPEGIGKTALLHAASRVAKGSGLAVYEFSRSDSAVPLSSTLPAIARIEAELSSHSDFGERIAQKYHSTLASLRKPTGHESPLAGENQIIEILSRFLVETATIFPFVIVVDDIEERDPQTAQLVSLVARDAMPGRVLTIVSTKDASAVKLPSSFATLALPQLSSGEVVQMAKSCFADDPLGGDLGDALHKWYGGVPGVLTEVMHSIGQLIATQDASLSRNREEFFQQLPSLLPRRFDDVLLAHYRSCSQDARLLLEYLSCFNASATVNALLRIFPTPERARSALNELASDGTIQLSVGGERVGIRQSRLKSAVYELIEDSRRQRHLELFVALEEVIEHPDFSDLVELGFHCRAAGNAEVASRYFEEAAKAGVSRRAFRRASELLRDAIECLSEEQTEARRRDLQTRRAQALLQAGLFNDAISEAEEVLEKERLDSKDAAPLHRTRGTAYFRLGRYDEARAAMVEALRAPWQKTQQLTLEQELTSVEIATGNFQKAEEACRAQLTRAEPLGNRQLVASINTNLGIVQFYQGRFDDAVIHFRAALDSYALTNQPILLADSMNNVGNALSAMGDYRAAIQYWTKALASSQDLGMLHQQGQIQNNLGIAYYNLRQFDRAKEYYTNAREIFERIGSRSGIAYTLTNLGEVTFAEGEYEPALHRWQDALRLYEEMDEPLGLFETSLQISQVLLMWGNVSAAARCVSDADRILNEKHLTSYIDQLEYARGMLALKSGDMSAARASFHNAERRYKEAGKPERSALCVLRLADCDIREEEFPSAVGRLLGILEIPSVPPAVAGEARYLLGTIGWKARGQAPEKPLVYFKLAMEQIQNEPVSELTWKLSFALAREYFERGQEDRARQYLHQARVILEFFISHFTTQEGRSKYLADDQRERVLATIDTLL